MQYVCRVPPPSTDISNRPAETCWSPVVSWITAAPYVLSPPIVAVAPPWFCVVSVVSAAAVPEPVNTPTATRPDTSAAAAVRAAPRLRADGAKKEENTKFPFEQDH